MKWKTFKKLIKQIDNIITEETDISISAGKMGEENTVEFRTADDEYPLFWIGEGKNTVQLLVKKKTLRYEE